MYAGLKTLFTQSCFYSYKQYIMKPLHFLIGASIMAFTSCKIIVQDEVGIKRTLGKLNPQMLNAGPRFFNPFISKIIT
jgi:prohibitin 1